MRTTDKIRRNYIFRVMFLVMLYAMGDVYAQNVTGVASDIENNEPLIGVTVLNLKSKQRILTDHNGKYSIKAELGEVLEFTRSGKKTISKKVSSTMMNIVMKSQSDELNKSVLVGYGNIKNKEKSGAVSQLKAKDLEGFVSRDLTSVLQGKMAGVNVSSANSIESGATATIAIRGVQSLIGGNGPLYVVDGVPYDQEPDLNLNEVETIDVLKDTASASIYGTRGAGGVIIITTTKQR